MRILARPSIITLLAMIGTALLSMVSTVTVAITLTATALIVPGTGTPDATKVTGYLQNAENYYITPFNPSCSAASSCTLTGINYPAQFWPIPLAGWGGLTGKKWNVSTGEGLDHLNTAFVAAFPSATKADPLVIMGYSQGANVVSRYKKSLAGLSTAQKDTLSFVMIGDTNRPNGGLFERLALLGTVPILDATFGLPAPTKTGIKTTDIAFQYDGVADFPLYPINVLADLNAILGFWYNHGTYLAPNSRHPNELPDGYTEAELEAALTNPKNKSTYGDTTYITIPTKTLPLLQPLLDIGKATKTMGIVKPLVDLISPVLRVLIDTGYNRNLSPGVPTPFELIPWVNPIKLAVDLVNATGAGIQAAVNDITGQAKSTAGTPTTVAATPQTTVTATNKPLTLVPPSAATTPPTKTHTKKPAAAVKAAADPVEQNANAPTTKKDNSAKKVKGVKGKAKPVASSPEKKAA